MLHSTAESQRWNYSDLEKCFTKINKQKLPEKSSCLHTITCDVNWSCFLW